MLFHFSATAQNPSYLALGDSYTVGTGIETKNSFPHQLSKQLGWQKPVIIAQNGWQTTDLLMAIDQENLNKKFDHVSVLIGVNNQFNKGNVDTYKRQLAEIIGLAIQSSKRGNAGVFVVSIPDYTVTPFGENWGKSTSSELDYWNEACAEVCRSLDVQLVDITPISRQAQSDESLLAKDKLHPSKKMYGLWVKEIVKQRDFSTHKKTPQE